MKIVIAVRRREGQTMAFVCSPSLKRDGALYVVGSEDCENMYDFSLTGRGINRKASRSIRYADFQLDQQPFHVFASYDSMPCLTPVLNMDAKDGIDQAQMMLRKRPGFSHWYALAALFRKKLTASSKYAEIHFELEARKRLMPDTASVTVRFQRYNDGVFPEPISLTYQNPAARVLLEAGRYRIWSTYSVGPDPLDDEVGGGEEGDIDIEPWP